MDAPRQSPALVGPAVTPQTAARHAAGRTGWSPSTSRTRPCGRCWTRTGRPGGRGPARLQVHLSWAPTRRRSAGHRPRPVAQQRVRPAGVLGRRDRRGIRRHQCGRLTRTGQVIGGRIDDLGAARGVAAGVRGPRLGRPIPAPRGKKQAAFIDSVRRARATPADDPSPNGR